MASLWSMLRKRRAILFDPDALGVEIMRMTDKLLQRHPPVLVNVADYVADIMASAPATLKQDSSMDMTPCHRSLWLEWLYQDKDGSRQRQAAHVYRMEPGELTTVRGYPLPENFDKVRFVLSVSAWVEEGSDVYLWSVSHVFIDKTGRALGKAPYYGAEDLCSKARLFVWLAGDVLTTLNTKGTRVEPPFARPVQIVKPDRAPCSVWHTIHIPKFREPSAPLDAEVSPEMLERREHWVRAHRADYRQGRGLFGRIHGLVWVPEHRRGNPELGTVKQSFEVQVSPYDQI